VHLTGLASEWVPSTDTRLTNTLYSPYEIDHIPPPVDKLPPASVTYLGRSFMLMTPDSAVVYSCLRKSGAYVWVPR